MGVNSFRARSDSTAPLETGDVHVCHICLKQFSRSTPGAQRLTDGTGDLRERHRRRCEKSIGKIIPTKKRSCERCISFKVKCDYEKPSCSRCLNRSVPCEYKLEPRVKMPLNPAFSLGPNSAFSGSLDVFSVQDGHQVELDSPGGHGLFGPQQHQHRGQSSYQQEQAEQQPDQQPDQQPEKQPEPEQHRRQHPHHRQHHRQHHHQHHQLEHMPLQPPQPPQQPPPVSLAAPEMAFDLSSSSASTDTCSLGDALSLDLARHGLYTACHEFYPDWRPSDGAGYAPALDASQWDATTVWSDASSSLLDPLMLDEAVLESGWATNFLDAAVCTDVYDQHCMLFGQDVDQSLARHAARSVKHTGKPAFLSY
ncbi:hypothetical protein E4U42_006407 [Claviceps africana]|uniref:Zn(2)-C6 fungal-type domain-containing protein n=1 Tax=Claviceps africana TaxID=83212 RepID=A0A8K0J2E4_9HYPO|nr:hypothetical protein E4U42_006407 [Claviceps africana]